ncbi:hypothetical protein J7T55_004517 [Diaporthe amygdali]|uniref:uncharacterized protein n=1 Tax=Phomopsis amygdali TaxID=1214568 RepID=UPI0022FEC1B2|nr:uncharacterized protein J7T55_004517 [Diaporthe amygdali]KAJ0114776.1 hypothetical protein J7T55_004517 [Diaporthe amygdali]
MVRIPSQIPRAPRKRQPLDNMLDTVESWIFTRNEFIVRRRAVDTPKAPTHHASAKRSSSSVTFPISTALVIQILVLIAMVISVILFIIYRRRRQKKLKQLDEQKRMNAPFFGNISAPNGLAPPPYGEALKSPAVSEATTYGHQRQRSNSMLMDECWKAVYAAEDGTTDPRYGSTNTTRPGHTSQSSWDAAAARVASRPGGELPEPASPQTAAQTDNRRSVTHWLRNQRWLPGGSPNPLNSNPLMAPSTPLSARMPVPPSPSYNGVTPSMAPTPTTATYLVAPAPLTPNQPLSARSWATGDDSLNNSARSTFVPQTALYPPPLQPAPKGNAASRSLTGNGRRSSAASWTSSIGDSYDRESGTWKTMTPHEDPPSHEPRRGNPEEVSPI